jgi:hypothetical protein
MQPFVADIPQFPYCSEIVVMPYIFCKNKIIRKMGYTKKI